MPPFDHNRLSFRRALPLAAAAAAILVPVLACRRPALEVADGSRPDLVLLTLDTCRADKLGAYGAKDGVTPALDRVASEGIVFERAISPVPLTLPAHASMLTGVPPLRHGVHLNGFYRLPDQATTIAESLSQAGYSTAAFVSSIVLSRDQGLAQGFDTYDDPSRASRQIERSAVDTLARARSFLRSHEAESDPVFVWAHLYDLHAPYKPPPPFFARYARDPYLGELAAVDAALVPFFEELRARTRPFVVLIVGDHGESLGEHGEQFHGFYVYEATQHVPLVLWSPALVRRPERVATPVSIESVDATLRELAGIASEDGIAPSLLPATAGRAQADTELVLESDMGLAGFGAVPLRALRRGRYKYVRAPTRELYDLEADPRELHNLAPQQPETVADLDRRLDSRLSGAGAASELADVDAATRAALEALGYTSGAPPRRPTSPQLDVKQIVPLLDLQAQARHLFEQRRLREALTQVDRILESCASAHAALDLGGRIAVTLGDFDLATRYYQDLTDHFPEEWLGPYNLGLAELSRRRPAAAVAALELAVERDPRRPVLRYGLGVALLAAGERDRGRESLTRFLDALSPAERASESEAADARRLLDELPAAD